eukprot:gnl/MRDRNA2_/MRDRNA2_25259_c0_seq1.p1 gnl/MRDRNA2_/MRDRNA2_25259_c0~~gnl/MRDRNA2_/MRDRNA2_25259_c0_seq1.p1  ORF type:complete len:277 (+),score=52.15 gnl/MRDRNA2_/MRDRNA2_25259_c0_seq1:59-889(+)
MQLFVLRPLLRKVVRPGQLQNRLAFRFETERRISVLPQWPDDGGTRHRAPSVGEKVPQWPPRRPQSEPMLLSPQDVDQLRTQLHRKIWKSLVAHDWDEWELGFAELRRRAIPYDESTYTLLLHGHVLSWRHRAENAYLVLEEMRRAEVHPALVRLNERLLNSVFELKELEARPPPSQWQNMARLCLHCAERFKKKRKARLKKELRSLDHDDVLKLKPSDVQRWLKAHDRALLPPTEEGIERFLPPRKEQLQLEGPESKPLAGQVDALRLIGRRSRR